MIGRAKGELHYASYGFEIKRVGDALWLANRGLWPIGMTMGVLAAGVILLMGIGARTLAAAGRGDAVGAACLLAAVLGLGVLRRLLSIYRSRRDQPLADVDGALVIHGERGLMSTAQGTPLASTASIKVAVRIAWWDGSRGLMRNVVLAWPGGRRVVFKTANRARAREVATVIRARFLRPHGSGRPGLDHGEPMRRHRR